MIGENHKVIEICKQGVLDLADKYSYYNLEYYHYFLSLAYRNINELENAHNHISKLITALQVQNNAYKYEKFNRLISADFHFSFDDLLKRIK